MRMYVTSQARGLASKSVLLALPLRGQYVL